MEKARQAIHTYPFKYRPMTAEEIFRPQRAAVYIHVPFCTKKCHFCDFVVRTNTTGDLRQRYVEAVCREIALFARASGLGTFSVDAIYIGGGTPSLLTEAQLIRIISACRENFAVTRDAELTVEFEPMTVSEEKVTALSQAGLNRVSMGVQSFEDELLAASNRSHRAADVYRALDVFRSAGVTNLNIDLIYPLPGLTWDIWASTVDHALAVHPAAVSLYALEIWPGTPYDAWNSAGQLAMPGAGTEVAMYLHAVERLEDAGYAAGSVNGYVDRALAAQYCRYLQYYWQLRPLLGFGVSSRSALGERLWRNCNSVRDYLGALETGRLPVDLGCVMTRQQEMRRFMVRGLKACTVSKAEFLGRFGVEMEQIFGAELARLATDGAISDSDGTISLTRRGRAYAPNVYQHFFTDADLGETSPGEVTYGVSSWRESAAAARTG
jgi:oxygen-independent coproporphyrinogen III oxidase